jgi:hypothetical protein
MVDSQSNPLRVLIHNRWVKQIATKSLAVEVRSNPLFCHNRARADAEFVSAVRAQDPYQRDRTCSGDDSNVSVLGCLDDPDVGTDL